MLLKVAEHLPGDFFEGLTSQSHRVPLKFTVGHELNNISLHLLSKSFRIERCIISIEHIHGAKISSTDSHDNYREGQRRAPYNLINSCIHVSDLSICDNEQDIVLLIFLGAAHLLSHIVDHCYDWGKVGRSAKSDVVDGFLICINNTI